MLYVDIGLSGFYYDCLRFFFDIVLICFLFFCCEDEGSMVRLLRMFKFVI